MQISPDRIRGVRHARRLTRAEVASGVERSAETLKAYEDGKLTPPAAVLPVLAGVLGVAVADLYRRYDDGLLDYVDAVAHCTGPLSDEQLAGAAAVLRAIGKRNHPHPSDRPAVA